MHKDGNVLNKLPKALQAKYEAACNCLAQDRDALLAFYDFPAEHWIHLRTTNPIESAFSTIRLRHRRTKGSGSRKASLMMMFKLAQSASRRWRRLGWPSPTCSCSQRKNLHRRSHAERRLIQTLRTQLLTIAPGGSAK